MELLYTLFLLSFLVSVSTKTISIISYGAVAGDLTAVTKNADALTWALGNATAGDTVVVPAESEPFYAVGGIQAKNLNKVTLQIDGQLYAEPDFKRWPNDGRHYLDFISLADCTNLVVTSSQEYGLIDGQGVTWWDREILNLLKFQRPKLIRIEGAKHLLVEKLHLHNSPSYHLLVGDAFHAEVRFVHVHVNQNLQRPLKEKMRALREQREGKVGELQPEDLNTDGIDPSGQYIYVHDCVIQNDDDSIAVKPCSAECKNAPCSQHMLFERLTLTGFGCSIGSVPPHDPPNCVRNITFRNITMPETGKGIYVKSNPECDEAGINGKKKSYIENLLFEDFEIIKPRWWSIWIGPQQQHEPHSALGRKCALDYPIDHHCPTQGCTTFKNITLNNIRVTSPWLSPGVIMGNKTNPMKEITFKDVVIKDGAAGGTFPYGNKYLCRYADDVKVLGKTTPKPDCGA